MRNALTNILPFLPILIFIGFITTPVLGQNTPSISTWIGVKINKEVGDFTLRTRIEFRGANEEKWTDALIFQPSLRYKLNDHFNLTGGLRYTWNERRTMSTEHNIRYQLDLKYHLDLSRRLEALWRVRYQKEYIDLFIRESDIEDNEAFIRNQLKLIYDLGKQEPFISAELWRSANAFDLSEFTRIRWLVGSNLKTRFGAFNISLGAQYNLSEEEDPEYLLRLQYRIVWK